MLFPSALKVAGFLAIGAEARYFKRSDGITISSRKTVSRDAPSPITITDAVLPLNKMAKGASAIRRSSLLQKLLTFPNGSTTGLTSLELGEEFSATVSFASQEFQLIVDTGSSDTWVVETGFTCVDFDTGKTTTESECAFGPLYTKSSTFSAISGETFSIEYGDGEELTGIVGTEDVTVAGITVDTEVALVTNADWEGDGTTSGLIGFAYPALTSAYKGSTQEVYNPIFTQMYSKGLIANDYFSLIIERDNSGPAGYIALGGVPDIAFTQNFTSTPIIVTNIDGYPDSYDFYTINIVNIQLNGAAISGSGGTTYEYIIDSGTTLNYVPTAVATKINAGFSPVGKYSSSEGVYIVSCTATPPKISIDIAGTLFYINPLDMILDAGDGTCISGFTQGGTSGTEDIFILGDTFQKNVVSVFDVGAKTMQFAGREYYVSDDTT
ncbi:putative aspartic-type endopeptidase [Lachnellula suecica]|uniref:Putative aspartic-type endopeptidase n=1 Tax=Lachnellula suecica TaxID=602035 RepID=A0A8T9CKK4_9HELO|nr:putative aspartic-type endopeptidase [Lachnellula suecica]